MAPLLAAAGLIAQHAIPALVGKLTGEKGEQVARAVVDTAMQVTHSESPGHAADVLAASPELALEFRAKLLEHDVVLERIAAEDRAGARARDVQVRQAGAWGNWRADLLAIGAVLLLWRIIEALLGSAVPDAGPARDVIMFLFGAVVAIVKDVYQFEFGSSRGSKDKSAQIGALNDGGRP